MSAFTADWRGYLSVYGSRFASLLLAAGLSVAGARILAPDGWGRYAAIGASVDLGSQVVNLGLSSALLVFLSRHPERVRFTLRRLWLLALGWALSLLLLFWVLRLAGVDVTGADRWWPAVAIWIPLKLLRIYQMNILTSLKAYGWISRLEVGSRLATLVFGLGALIRFPADVIAFVCAIVLADLLAAVVGAIVLEGISPRPSKASPDSDRETYSSVFRLALRAYPLLLLPWILLRADLLLVRGFRGPREAGLYSVVSQLIDVGFILPGTIAAFAVPTLAREGGTAMGLLRLCRWLAILLVAGSLLVGAFGQAGLRIVFGAQYLESYSALVLLLPGFIALSVESVLIQYFALQNYPSFLLSYWLAAVAVNLGLNLLLIPRFGFVAAAATSSLGYLLVSALVLRRFLSDARLTWGSVVSLRKEPVVS